MSVRRWNRRITPTTADAVREHFPNRTDQQRFLASRHHAALTELRARHSDEYDAILNDLVLRAIDREDDTNAS